MAGLDQIPEDVTIDESQPGEVVNIGAPKVKGGLDIKSKIGMDPEQTKNILDSMHKDIKNTDIDLLCEKTRKYGIRLITSYVLGYPSTDNLVQLKSSLESELKNMIKHIKKTIKLNNRLFLAGLRLFSSNLVHLIEKLNGIKYSYFWLSRHPHNCLVYALMENEKGIA